MKTSKNRGAMRREKKIGSLPKVWVSKSFLRGRVILSQYRGNVKPYYFMTSHFLDSFCKRVLTYYVKHWPRLSYSYGFLDHS